MYEIVLVPILGVIPSAARNPAAKRGRGVIPRFARNDMSALRFLLPIVCALIVGCGRQGPSEPNSITKQVDRGPFRLTVEVAPARAWVGDPLTVELRVETPDEHLVQFPTEEDFGELQIRHVETADPRPGLEGGLVWQQTISAESFTSGVVEVPSLVVKYARKPAQADIEPAFEHELTTEPLEIEVRSALTTQESVFEPRDITGTLTPPREPLGPWAWAAIAGAIVGGAAAIVAAILWLRRRAKRPPPPILPEVWALRALADLQAANLIGGGQAKEFYYRLSEIVRVYIERKFSLAAPEMTTEEFLVTLARDRGALPYDADRLRSFLQACDLVKYAALTPRESDAEQALGTARAFIDATAAAQQRAAVAGAPGAAREQGGQAA
jgi:hypothetical protein